MLQLDNLTVIATYYFPKIAVRGLFEVAMTTIKLPNY